MIPTRKPILPQLQRGHPRARGLRGAWLFFEGGGSSIQTIHDMSGWGKHGQTRGTNTFWGADIRHGGLALDHNAASGTGVTTPHVSGTTFTWLCWFLVDAFTNHRSLMTIRAGNYMLMDTKSGGDGSFWSSDGLDGSNYGVTGMSTGEWYLMGFSREGNSITGGYRMFLDGENKGSADTGTWSSSDDLWIGQRQDSSQPHDGKISACLVYDRVLSDDEHREHYEDFWSLWTPPEEGFLLAAAAAPATPFDRYYRQLLAGPSL